MVCSHILFLIKTEYTTEAVMKCTKSHWFPLINRNTDVTTHGDREILSTEELVNLCRGGTVSLYVHPLSQTHTLPKSNHCQLAYPCLNLLIWFVPIILMLLVNHKSFWTMISEIFRHLISHLFIYFIPLCERKDVL